MNDTEPSPNKSQWISPDVEPYYKEVLAELGNPDLAAEVPFSDKSPKAPSGLTAAEIALILESHWRKWNALEADEDLDVELAELTIPGWVQAVEWLMGVLDQRIEPKWSVVSDTFKKMCTKGGLPYDLQNSRGLPQLTRQWEALIRIAANLITAEDEQDLIEAKNHDWTSFWLDGKPQSPQWNKVKMPE